MHADGARKLFQKSTTLRDSAKQLSVYLQQKEMLWAQINASKRITTAKELVGNIAAIISLRCFSSLMFFFLHLC